MKKLILICLVALGSTLTMNAQWSGTNPLTTDSDVWIGFTNGSSRLSVSGDTSTPSTTAGTINGISRVYGTGSNTATMHGIGNYSSNIYHWIQTKNQDSNTHYPISLNPLGGYVGINTKIPTFILSLGNQQAQKIWIENTASGTVGRALTFSAGSTVGGTNITGGELFLQSGLGTGTGTSTMSFQTGTTLTSGSTLQTYSTKMTILGNGNVGIGTTAPTDKLHIVDSRTTNGSVGAYIDKTGAISGTSYGIYVTTTGASTTNTGGFFTASGATTNYAARFNTAAATNNWNIYAGGTAQNYFEGSVGIGTSTPTSKLHVKDGSFYIEETGIGHGMINILPNDVIASFGKNNSSGGLGITGISNSASGNGLALIGYIGAGSTTNPAVRVVGGVKSGSTYTTVANGDLLFSVTNAGATTKLVILGSGDVGIGTAAPGYLLSVNGEPGCNGFTQFNNYSDSTLKTNISNIGSSLAKIMKLRPVQFHYNQDYLNIWNDTIMPNNAEELQKIHRGFIAQEVKQIFPEMVDVDSVKGQAYCDLNLSNLQVYLVKAMQEQQTIIDSLRQNQKTSDSLLNHQKTIESLLTTTLNNMVVHQRTTDSLISQQKNADSLLVVTVNNLMASVANCCSQSFNPKNLLNNSEQKQGDTLQVELANNDQMILYQNQPNPFDENTVIRYFVPENIIGTTSVIFYDMYGQEIKRAAITTKGFGNINVNSENLVSGIYSYSLFVDGKVIDTKKMIKNN